MSTNGTRLTSTQAWVLALPYALAEIVWLPFATEALFQLKLSGGPDAKYWPSI